MELREALEQIDAIRSQVSAVQEFRGYRAATVAGSGLLALSAAVGQAYFVPMPDVTPQSYVSYWAVVAVISMLSVAAELVYRVLYASSQLERDKTIRAIEQFLPCVIAGGLLTWVLLKFAPESMWIVPGLWSILFSLGIFASVPQLSRTVQIVGVYYLVGGIACIALAREEHAFSPWAMAGTFGVGQLLTAAVLYWTQERRHVRG